MIIKIYIMQGCSYCNELKSYLNTDNIPYIDVDILKEENKNDYLELCKRKHVDVVPVILINNDIFRPNIEFKTILEGFNIIKSKLTDL